MVEISDFKYLYLECHFFPFYKIALPDNISQVKFNYVFKAKEYLEVKENSVLIQSL